MKIGISIPNYYAQFLDEIANLNNSNKTAICSLIVENFLSYNKRQKKFPLFRKDVRIVFANEVPKSSVDDSGSSSDINDVHQDSEQSSSFDRSQLVDIPEDPEGLSDEEFEEQFGCPRFDSED